MTRCLVFFHLDCDCDCETLEDMISSELGENEGATWSFVCGCDEEECAAETVTGETPENPETVPDKQKANRKTTLRRRDE